MHPHFTTDRRRKSIAKRKTVTSSEVKNRWNAKTYKRYTVNLRKDEDAELIQLVDDYQQNGGSVSDLFRIGAETLKNDG